VKKSQSVCSFSSRVHENYVEVYHENKQYLPLSSAAVSSHQNNTLVVNYYVHVWLLLWLLVHYDVNCRCDEVVRFVAIAEKCVNL